MAKKKPVPLFSIFVSVKEARSIFCLGNSTPCTWGSFGVTSVLGSRLPHRKANNVQKVFLFFSVIMYKVRQHFKKKQLLLHHFSVGKRCCSAQFCGSQISNQIRTGWVPNLILWMINTKQAVFFFINKLMDNTSIDLCDRILQGFKCGAIGVS